MVWEHLDGDQMPVLVFLDFIPSSIEQTGGLESGCFPVGITPTYTATDENGIVTSCTFNVTARDVEKPVLLKELTTALDASQIAEIHRRYHIIPTNG
jgi:hypothetical protein